MPDWSAFVRAKLALDDRRPALRERVARELSSQLQDAFEDGLQRGLSDNDATTYALEQLGDVNEFLTAVRSATESEALPMLDRASEQLETLETRPGAWRSIGAGFGAELLHAIRAVGARRSFAVVAVGVLALAIGAATAIFSVVDAVVLRGLPFPSGNRLVTIVERDPKRAETLGGGRTTAPNYLDWRREQRSFDALAAVTEASFRITRPGDEPSDARALAVTHEFFPVLGVVPILGRPLNADDETPGHEPVIVLSHAFWQRQFGGVPDVIGRTLDLNERPRRIVGVMPPGFNYPVAVPRPTELYVPAVFDQVERARESGRWFRYTTIARLKTGVTLAQAEDQMVRLASAMDREHHEWSDGRTVRVVRLQEHLVGRLRPWMLMLLASVGLVLLLACANIANLLLARATTRSRETGIRAALGASRWRIVRGHLAEALVLSGAGAVGGVIVAWALVSAIRAWLPIDLPRVAAVGVNWRVLAAAVCTAVITGLFSGLVPGVIAARRDVHAGLADGGRSATGGHAGHRLRAMLVVGEIAIACVLLVGAGLFTRSFLRLLSVDPGFDSHSVLALPLARLQPQSPSTNGSPSSARQFAAQVLEAVRSLPDVEAAGTVSGGLPLTGQWSRQSVTLPGRGELAGDEDDVDVRQVSIDYLRVLRVPLLAGRHFTEADGETTMPVVMVNEAAARKYWPGQPALGQRITLDDRERLVVGVVGNIHHLGPETPVRQEAYIPASQARGSSSTLVVRTRRPPLEVLPAVRTAIRSVDRTARFSSDVVTLDGYLDRLLAQRRFTMALTALLGILALFIATAGVYGVMAYSVAQRVPEIGVRMALGATPRGVLGMVAWNAAVLVAVGLAVGGACAWFLAASVRAFLFEVKSDDPLAFVGALLALGMAALVAGIVPARRASAIDPLAALRHE